MKIIGERLLTELAQALKASHPHLSGMLMALPDVEKNQEIDITAPRAVNIQVRHDSKVVWVNVDGRCVLRCCQIQEGVSIQDDRKRHEHPHIPA